jgi:hypothetical protein
MSRFLEDEWFLSGRDRGFPLENRNQNKAAMSSAVRYDICIAIGEETVILYCAVRGRSCPIIFWGF